MDKITDITELCPHKVSEVICVQCGARWHAIRPVETKLRELECVRCEKQGFVIETGEELPND